LCVSLNTNFGRYHGPRYEVYGLAGVVRLVVPVPVAAQGLRLCVRALLFGIDGFRGVFVRLGGAEGPAR
jgi:hypothetical protein